MSNRPNKELDRDDTDECRNCRELLSAYLDSELDPQSSLEISERLRKFERCRDCFAREKFLDDWMRVKLAERGMPEEMWQQLCEQVHEPAARSRLASFRSLVAVAAVVVLVVAAVGYRQYVTSSDEAGIAGERRQTMAELLSAAAPQLVAFRDPAAENALERLREVSREVLGVTVSLELNNLGRHQVDIIGVSEGTDAGGRKYLELRLNCCHHPVIVAIGKCGGSAVCELCEATDGPRKQRPSCCPHSAPSDVIEVQSERRDGFMIAAAAANHPVDALLKIIRIDRA